MVKNPHALSESLKTESEVAKIIMIGLVLERSHEEDKRGITAEPGMFVLLLRGTLYIKPHPMDTPMPYLPNFQPI